MSAFEGSAATTGLAALCAIFKKEGIISSDDIEHIIKSMEFKLQGDDQDSALSQAKVNVRQKFSWF